MSIQPRTSPLKFLQKRGGGSEWECPGAEGGPREGGEQQPLLSVRGRSDAGLLQRRAVAGDPRARGVEVGAAVRQGLARLRGLLQAQEARRHLDVQGLPVSAGSPDADFEGSTSFLTTLSAHDSVVITPFDYF